MQNKSSSRTRNKTASDLGDPFPTFADRLRYALAAANARVSGPSSLEREFNQHYRHRPIARQTAHNWLSGNCIPSDDKIEALGVWLGVDPAWLRDGGDSSGRQSILRRPAHESASPEAARYSSDLPPEKLLVDQITRRAERLSIAQLRLLIQLIDGFFMAERLSVRLRQPPDGRDA